MEKKFCTCIREVGDVALSDGLRNVCVVCKKPFQNTSIIGESNVAREQYGYKIIKESIFDILVEIEGKLAPVLKDNMPMPLDDTQSETELEADLKELLRYVSQINSRIDL